MLIVLLISRKDYEPFLADVVFAFDGLENSGENPTRRAGPLRRGRIAARAAARQERFKREVASYTRPNPAALPAAPGKQRRWR